MLGRFSRMSALVVVAALGVELWLASLGKSLSVDDYFRVFHAMEFLERPRFALSAVWMPGYAWVEGAVMAASRETWWTPRLVGVAFALASILVASRSRGERPARALAAMLVASSPLFVLVAPTPLSEPMFVFACMASARALAEFRVRALPRDAALSVLAAAFASTIRYEGWLLLPIVAYALLSRRGTRTPLRWRVAFVAVMGVFPVCWLAHVAEREGSPFAFLSAVRTDMFGPGDLAAWLDGPSLYAVLVSALSFAGVVVSIRTDRRPSARVYQAFAMVLFGASALALASGSVPSQLPIRILLPGTLLAAVPVAALVVARARPSIVLAVAGLGLGMGAAIFLETPDATPAGAREIGLVLGRELARDASAHVLTHGRFPDVASVEVASSGIGRVHIEGSRRQCPIHLLTCDSPCAERPEFADDIRFAVLEDVAARRLAEAASFVPIAESGRYRLYRRDRGAPPLCPPGARR